MNSILLAFTEIIFLFPSYLSSLFYNLYTLLYSNDNFHYMYRLSFLFYNLYTLLYSNDNFHYTDISTSIHNYFVRTHTVLRICNYRHNIMSRNFNCWLSWRIFVMPYCMIKTTFLKGRILTRKIPGILPQRNL